MSNLELFFSEENIKVIKEAYKRLYLKSRSYDIDSKMKDVILEKVVKDLFFEVMEKNRIEGLGFSEEESIELYQTLKKNTDEWYYEFENQK